MSKSIKKMLVFLFILVAVSTLFGTVKATTIKETTNTNDKYDTITSGTIIIGVSKFTPDQTVTGIKAATAGSNDRLVYTLKNGDDTNYSYPKMYYYLNTSWYEYDAEGNLKYLKDGIESLDIYYVNNKLKQGINLPTKPVEKAEYKVFFVDEAQQVSKKTIVEGEKLGELPTLTKPHYTVSWVDSKGNTVNADTVITEDTVFFAKWTEATKVELILNMNGKSSTQAYYVGDEVKTTPEKTGYEFLGWYTADGKKYDKTFKMPETNLTLTAKWNKTVTNVDELEKGIANATETTVITLANDITDINKTLTVNKKITLEGNGKALKFAEIPKVDAVASALVISSDDVVVNNLTVEMTQINGWKSNYAIQVYNSKGVVLNNVVANNGDAGIIVNASEVELKGITKLNNNEFGGIEVSKGKTEGLPNSKLTVTGTIEMNNEKRTVPVVWVERNADDSYQGEVIGLENYVQREIKEASKNQIYYYSDLKYATTAEVSTLAELNKALSEEQVTTIKLTSNIEGINESLKINRKLTFEGNNKTLKFNKLEKKSGEQTASALVISSNDTVVNNLTVEMTQIDGWKSNYVIQVYNAKGVVLNNVAANNGDGGIIVNASEVELKGTTKLNNNEFGGIEVSKGKAEGLSNSKLTVTGTIEMNNEESTVPVVWVERNADDSCQGKVIGLDKYTQKVIKENGKNQLFFYSDAKYETTQRVSDSNELSEALEKGNDVVLTNDVSITQSINVPKGKKVVFDTNGYNITSGVTRSTADDLFIIDGGILEITGNGTMTALDSVVEVHNGGKLIVKSGNFVSKIGLTLYTGSATNPPILGGEIIIEGGTFKGQEGCVGVANGGKLTVNGGEFTAIDNAIIAGNGTKAATGEMKDTEINITNGTFNGGITSSGYIAMGIYHPQRGTLNVTGGTFNITKGSGIIMRSGTLNLSGAKFNYTNKDDTFKGWAGDKKSQIPVGKDVVKCTHPEPAGYAYNVVLNNVADTYTVLEFAE